MLLSRLALFILAAASMMLFLARYRAAPIIKEPASDALPASVGD
jgi:hypothetical protein